MYEQWKISRITPVPKQFPPKIVESDLLPITVTNAIAKVAEKFVSKYFNEFLTIIQILTSLDVFMDAQLHMLC